MKTKKKLVDMTTDEFLAHGMDSDVSSGDEEKPVQESESLKTKKQKVKKHKKSESSKHKEQLNALEQKDPEFFKFLQENDKELLDFSGSEDGEDLTPEDGGDGTPSNDSDESGDESSQSEEDKADSENAESENEDGIPKDEIEGDIAEEEIDDSSIKEGKTVTQEMIKKWRASLEKGSIKSLKIVMHAFHSAVVSLSPAESQQDGGDKQKQVKNRYVVEGGTIFNNLVTLCLRYSVKILEKTLNYDPQKNSRKKQLPSASKQWGSMKITVKQYLLDILQLLRQVGEPTVLSIVLKHSQALLPYYATFPKIAKMLIKRSVRMWCTGEEHVRVLAFLLIRKLTILLPSLFEYALKNLYSGFVRNTKFVTLKTKPLIQFMQNSLVEMYALDESLTYQQAFVYIRQLAIHLRNAITNKKKESHQAVYNWQYISCLQLWCHVVCDLYGDVLKPLVYPLVQITIGVISLIPSTRYYPLRFTCIKLLNKISEKTGVYIPTAAYIVEAIELAEFNKRPTSSEKPPDFNCTLKLTKPQLSTKAFQDVTVDLVFETLLEHYAIYSHSIAFPELVFPICHRLKRLIKSNQQMKLCKDMKTLVDKLHSYGEEVRKERDLVTFAPKDIDQVKNWEEERKMKNNSLREFFKTWLNMKKISVTEETTQQSQETSEKIKKRKLKEAKRNNESKKAKLKRKKSKGISVNNEEDILEEFRFSDDEAK